MPMPLSSRERRIQSILKMKKSAIIAAHKAKHPTDPALYRRSKREIALEVMRPAWWPVRDFPVAIEEAKK